jgi:hypothetical protein
LPGHHLADGLGKPTSEQQLILLTPQNSGESINQSLRDGDFAGLDPRQ